MAHADENIVPLAVVSGASSGIGRATAIAFARKGWHVVAVSRDMAALQEVAAACRRYGAEALPVAADLGKADEVQEVAQKALALGGRIDAWVANAGIGAVGAFQETPIEAHEQVIRTNLLGHINEAYAALPIFIRQRKGVFINMISLGGFAAAPFAAAYSASKFGLRGFSEALRGELLEYPHIHVCDVYPSFVDTPGIANGGNYVGRKLSAPPPLLDPRSVAAAIVKLARKPKPTTMLGTPTWMVRLAHVVSPQLTSGFMALFLRSYFARARAVPMSDGNLFAPPAGPRTIDGGLRSPRKRKKAANAMMLMGSLAVVALAARASRRPR